MFDMAESTQIGYLNLFGNNPIVGLRSRSCPNPTPVPFQFVGGHGGQVVALASTTEYRPRRSICNTKVPIMASSHIQYACHY
jgi:hypothetical protein